MIFFGEPFLIYEKGSDDKYSAGEDQLINIKYLQFDDMKVALDPSGLIFDVATYVSPDINPDVNFIQLPTNDFNDDTNSDILWRNIDGSVAIWSLDGNAATPKSLSRLGCAQAKPTSHTNTPEMLGCLLMERLLLRQTLCLAAGCRQRYRQRGSTQPTLKDLSVNQMGSSYHIGCFMPKITATLIT